MKRYFNILGSYLSLSVKQYLEHRWSTFGNLISAVISLLTTLFLIEIIFLLTKDINNWNKNEVFIFMGLFNIFITLFSLFFLKSINRLPDYIRNGELDIILVKPVNAQFVLSFSLIRIYEILNLLPGIILVWYGLNNLSVKISLFDWLLLGISFISGLLILYSIYFSCAVLSFWLIKFGSLQSIFYMIKSSLSFPLDLLGNRVSWFLTFIVPLGFIITVPVKIFLMKISGYYILVEIILAVVLVLFSSWFFNLALKRYTSASS